MVNYILFMDVLRQEEIEKFYTACQMHRDYYKGYPKHYHPITYFKEPEYMWQCPSEMSHAYLSFPAFHVKYKQPAILPPTAGRTSVFPQLPDRSLAGRYNKAACKAFVR
ncbi:hypothetical protein K1T71_010367 [Dendrolimus kikuchii]|uniref:Uncharacterized protein n=1 Tax=Dendrolimus kikuchii TaxID=765133 RepID=A0ACC1CRJ7_9NEOP|nr:hypothetical protein K1T71_010367 [Dendrolimus kikuchii]